MSVLLVVVITRRWRSLIVFIFFFFFFNDTATTEIYTLSLHDALPISGDPPRGGGALSRRPARPRASRQARAQDRKSTRLNSSHSQISYAVFCLKKKKIAKTMKPSQYIMPPKQQMNMLTITFTYTCNST